MRDQKKRALASAKFWLNRCYDLGITVEEVVAASVVNHSAVNHKENEKAKEKAFPHTPYKEKGKKQEKAPTGSMLADANGGLGDVSKKPPRIAFLAWCQEAGFIDRELCEEKYEDLALCGWRNAKGKPIMNWPKYFLRLLRGNTYKGAYQKLTNDQRTFFDAFWNLYPPRRRVEKDKCAKKFQLILEDSPDPVHWFNKIMEGLRKWCASPEWQKEGGEYVMMPYRWLNNTLWQTTPGFSASKRIRGVSQTANVHSVEVGKW